MILRNHKRQRLYFLTHTLSRRDGSIVPGHSVRSSDTPVSPPRLPFARCFSSLLVIAAPLKHNSGGTFCFVPPLFSPTCLLAPRFDAYYVTLNTSQVLYYSGLPHFSGEAAPFSFVCSSYAVNYFSIGKLVIILVAN